MRRGKKCAVLGVAVSVDVKQFERLLAGDEIIETPYQFCVWLCLHGVQICANENLIRGDIAYLFEAGHQHGPAANKMMTQIFNDPGLRQNYRYSAHGFIDKKKALPCQAADILAWQWFTQQKRIRKNIELPMRKDLVALMEKRHYTIHGSAEMIFEVKQRIQEGTERYRRLMEGP